MKFFIFIFIFIGFETWAQPEESSDLSPCSRLDFYFQFNQNNPLVLVNPTANRLFIENFIDDLDSCPTSSEDTLRYLFHFLNLMKNTPSLSSHDDLIQVSERVLQNLPLVSRSNVSDSEIVEWTQLSKFLEENNLIFRVNSFQNGSPMDISRQQTQASFFGKKFNINRILYLVSFEPTFFCQDLPEVRELIAIEEQIQTRIEEELIQKKTFHPHLTLQNSLFETYGSAPIHSQANFKYFDFIIDSLSSLENSKDFVNDFIVPLRGMSYARSLYTEKIHEYCFLPAFLDSKKLYINKDVFSLEDEVTPEEERTLVQNMSQKLNLFDAWFVRLNYNMNAKQFEREVYYLAP